MLSVRDTAGYVLDMEFRMPFHFGDTEITSLPHLFLVVEAEFDGERATGLAAEGLSPLWFVKDPDLTFAGGLADMVDVVDSARSLAEEQAETASVFDYWHRLYESQREWASDTDHPPLLWGFGVSMVERGLVDAYCRHHDVSFASALRSGAFGVDPGRIYPELDGADPADLLPQTPARELTLRHTVGFTDPLTDEDLGPNDRLDDGLPQTLAEYLDAQRLTHFKVKLSGDPSADADRLGDLASLFDDRGLAEYAVTLDANEQFDDAAAFRDAWTTFVDDPDVAPLLDRTLYVEQPLARDEAMTAETRRTFASWDDRPPTIVDESDALNDSLGRALDCGYDGTSHKNCKGVFRGVVNACLLERRRRENPDRDYVLSGEDLTTVGPVSLLQDLAVVASLDVGHVERNGHHYFTGLSMLPDDVQSRLLAEHGDLYREHEAGYATLDVTDGRVRVDSTVDVPFGYDVEVDPSRFTPVEDWTFDA
ncbi:hypothetical protein [Halomicrococcus sp. NG-SE-24]|uniref:hypothetical protein n=1 Tax=Halomicrococcus sp. NG-SE-24 TaxID=3436928 RepID=UPI003D972FBD